MNSSELRNKYIEYFVKNGHTRIKSASLIPDNDPTVLFTTAGMHPLVPYLLGQKHPGGNRLTNVQKCVRTGDIDEVGDSSHCTFFEMLGNWSLGDYFKEESIKMSFNFLVNELKIDINKIAVSVFAGDENAPRDMVSADCWKKLGIKEERIFFLPKKNNWWGPAGVTGPCGPDTEIFIVNEKAACGEDCSPACSCGKYLEIWNNVFMEYEKKADGSYVPLSQKNVDTGMGLERTVSILNGNNSVYEIDVFKPVMDLIKEKASGIENIKAIRVIADHIRTATFMLGDEKGITPSNVDQGYILRRLIRRAVRFARLISISPEFLPDLAKEYIKIYGETYPEIKNNEEKIISELQKEILRFDETLQKGLIEFEKLKKYIQNNRISGKAAFRLYDTFGFPIEMTIELAEENGITVDKEGYEECFREHQEKSHAGAEQKFKGGLADNSEQTSKLHTATHILLATLKRVLKDNTISQKGSNITAERLRFDFNFERPLTEEEIKEVEKGVNEVINRALPITCEEMSAEVALKSGAEGAFAERYGEVVKVYSIGDYSKEICGGPHAGNTKELGKFSISKEQSSSAGIRRIKAVLE
ncbi:MAG: alanine--tRNA ligase [Clostridiales bacterium]|jgi:alanyl-tRNA synthetase|nr:alanine--tRNA ligase [Clostridiales bacterium]